MLDTYEISEETPFTFASAADFDCSPRRGGTGKSLLIVNHWIQPGGLPDPVVADRTNSEQGHVAEDVLSLKQRKLAARKDLAPLPADRQVNLTHVDIRAELVMCVTCVLDLWRKAEVDAKVHSGFLAPGLERGERWEQPCA